MPSPTREIRHRRPCGGEGRAKLERNRQTTDVAERGHMRGSDHQPVERGGASDFKIERPDVNRKKMSVSAATIVTRMGGDAGAAPVGRRGLQV